MRLEVDENNCIRIYRAGEDFAFFKQPNWPNGTAWRSHEEATDWGQAYLQMLETGGDLPPLHPGE
jgi:hypothetical protein